MALTTVDDVGGIMGFTFTGSSTPSSTQVENIIIPMAERKVNRMSIPSATPEDKSDLTSLWSAHLISISKDIDFRNADISISSKRIPTHYSKEFFDIVVDKGGRTGTAPLLEVANPSGR